jgi:hypothetical protein
MMTTGASGATVAITITMTPSQPSGSGTGNCNDSLCNSRKEKQDQERDMRAKRRNNVRDLAGGATKPKRTLQPKSPLPTKQKALPNTNEKSLLKEADITTFVSNAQEVANVTGRKSSPNSPRQHHADKNAVAGGDKDASGGNDNEAPVLVADDESAATSGGSPSPSKNLFAMKDVGADAVGIAVTCFGVNNPPFSPLLNKNVIAAVSDSDSRNVHISEKDLPTYQSADDSTRDGEDDDSESTDLDFNANDGTDDDDDDFAAADDDDPNDVSSKAVKKSGSDNDVSSKAVKKSGSNKPRCKGLEFTAHKAELLQSFHKVNSSIEVPRRGERGRPKEIKRGMLHKYGATIAYAVTFNKVPKDKEVMDPTKPKWRQFRKLYNELMDLNEFTKKKHWVRDSGSVQVGGLFGNLRAKYNVGTWDAQNLKLEKEAKTAMFSKYADELKEWGFLE